MNRMVIGFQKDFIDVIVTSEHIERLDIINKDRPQCLEFVDGLTANAQDRQIVENVVAALGVVGDRCHGGKMDGVSHSLP